MSLASHQRRKGTVTWLTPPEWISLLGPFDLDPCCPPSMPWPTAKVMLSLPTDGLAEPWRGRVWLNPPFGRSAAWWVKKLAEHGDGIALIHACTETDMWYGSPSGTTPTPCASPRGGRISTLRTAREQTSTAALQSRLPHTGRTTSKPWKDRG